MAPMAVYQSLPTKRSASSPSFELFGLPPHKKQNRGQIRHHQPNWDFQRKQLKEPWQDEEAVQSMLTRSIGLALEAVGFEAAAPDAMEAFRVEVEEYMAHYLADVRQSMLSCRRTQAIPQDFLQALHTHQLSLRSLLPHLDPPLNPSRTQMPLQMDIAQDNDEQHLRFLGPLLNADPNEKLRAYVPKHFPELPSKHTYKATPEYAEHEQDPRKVREKATEEGRLGEEALRRLVGAGAGISAPESRQGQKTQSARAVRDQVWKETMQAVTQEAPHGMDLDTESGIGKGKQKEGDLPPVSSSEYGRLGSAVNADKRYWRKPAPQKREANGSI
ncbi:MAG: hypothetical protein ASARMPRED_001261 [Alectoria sarmentosa]|nr:MAG: hypothetical protein ASARMPRED_001261 [Alectoria sarmentosa]